MDEELRSHFEQFTSPSAVNLLEITRLALYESTSDFQDIFFTLMTIIYQQLKSRLESPDEDCDLRLLTGLLSLIFSSEAQFLQRLASKMLLAPPAFPSKAERRLYYRSEVDALLRVRQQLMTGAVREDQRNVGPSQNAFLDVYLPKIASLLEGLLSGVSCGDAPLRITSPFGLCQQLINDQPGTVLQEARQALARISQSSTCSTSLSNQETAARDLLLLILASSAMACSNLRVDSVHMNLQHVVQGAQLRLHKPMTKEQLACFTTSFGSHFESTSNPSSTESTKTTAWSLENALQFARATQTMDRLVAFCFASKSLLAHKCLKEICILQAKLFLNSKNLLFEKRVEVTHQLKALHLQICESYIGEMVGLLREVPLVLQFKHAIKGRDMTQSDAFSSSKDIVLQGFEAFTRCILAGMDDVNEDLPALKEPNNRFWKRSSRESRVQSRCLRLKSRIMWHLKQLATYDEQNLVQIFERIFLIDFLSGRCGNTEEAKLVAKFVDKAQDAVSCDQWQQKRLSFDNYQQLFSKTRGTQSHYRVDKVVRSLALLVWAIWIRERCAYCLRSIELLKGHEILHKADKDMGDAERKRLGSLAATCALQLNVLGILVDKPDDIFALQISLLEEAAKFNPEKAIAVICWAFPADKIQARYLKRYKALRQLLKADPGLSTDAPPIEETEHRCQFIQRHVKRSIRWSITSGSMKPGSADVESPKKPREVSRSWTAEIDVLVDCCCDLEFQKVTWALIQKKFAGGSRNSQQIGGDADSSSQLKRMLLQSRSSTADGVISRQEVMLLLQEQKRELEGKVRSWSTIGTTCFQETKPRDGLEVTSSHSAPSQDQRNPTAGTEMSFLIRDIDFEGDGCEVTSPNRKRKQSQQIERKVSVQNVLKLLNLRKQRGTLSDQRSDSLPNLLNRSGALRSQPQRAATSNLAPIDTDSVPSPKRHARESGGYQVTSPSRLSETHGSNRAQLSRGHSSMSISPPVVFPLTYGADVEGNSFMKLLDRSSGGRSTPLKARHFSFQQRIPSPSQDSDNRVQAWDGGIKRSQFNEEKVVNLKPAGAQTDELPGDVKSAEIVKTIVAQDDTTTPLSSVGTQSESSGATYEAGVQCAVKQTKPSESVNLETSISVETEGILSRFPVFVDLEPSPTRTTQDAPKKFLQIARFSTHSVIQTRGFEREKVVHATPGTFTKNEANQSLAPVNNGIHQLPISDTTAGAAETDPPRRQSLAELLVTHQSRYRNHFALSDLNSKLESSWGNSTSSGRSSLIGLKEDMARLKTRLVQLEHCADEIDEDFKDSHHVRSRSVLLCCTAFAFLTALLVRTETGSHREGAR